MSIHTLIVDDDFAVTRLHKSFLERAPGFSFAGSAHTVHEAMRRIHGGDIDLVLLDLYLPGASGVEMLRRILVDPAIDVDAVVVSAGYEGRLVQQAVSLGVADFLLKPFTIEEFQARLARYREARQERFELAKLPRLNQAQIDRLRGAHERPLPTRLASELNTATQEKVLDGLRRSAGPATAQDIAKTTGLSRASARRYLEGLVAAGIATVRPRYGDTGRPQHEYTLIGLAP